MNKDLATRVAIYAVNAINPGNLANPWTAVICGGSDLVREWSPTWDRSPYRRLLNLGGAAAAVIALGSGVELNVPSLFETACDAAMVYALGRRALQDYSSLSMLASDLSLARGKLTEVVKSIEDQVRR